MTTTIMLDDDTRQALSTALLVWMEVISEDRYAAGWYAGLERELWLDDDDDEDVRQLRVLARACGGWWTWADAADDESGGPTFVPLAVWEDQMREDA